MAESADQSHLDLKYFIDPHIYNCPYCNRRHVSYSISHVSYFHWSHLLWLEYRDQPTGMATASFVTATAANQLQNRTFAELTVQERVAFDVDYDHTRDKRGVIQVGGHGPPQARRRRALQVHRDCAHRDAARPGNRAVAQSGLIFQAKNVA